MASCATPKFLAVEVAPTKSPPGKSFGSGSIEISWPGGPVVRVVGDVCASTLAAAVHAVAEAPRC